MGMWVLLMDRGGECAVPSSNEVGAAGDEGTGEVGGMGVLIHH